MSFSVMPPTPRCTMAMRTSPGLELAQALGHGLERAVHIGLHDGVQSGGLAPLDPGEDILELGPSRQGVRLAAQARQPLPVLTGVGHPARDLLVGSHHEGVARDRDLRQAQDLDRCGRRSPRRRSGPARRAGPGPDPRPLPRPPGRPPAAFPAAPARWPRDPARCRGSTRARPLPLGPPAKLGAPRPRPRAESDPAAHRCLGRSGPRSRSRSCAPPQTSGTSPCSATPATVLCVSAFGRSILLTATTMGTSAALAWLMASTVWGITPSSAATTRTTMSVALAPRARIAVNASWPRSVYERDSTAVCARPGRRRCAE